ncbi:hypothetical protein [Helicobacter salomonis]|uniref:hypothetical protein n=1 Tax=Helicobacter salomonis TaxID=56878 RepID=UPI00131578F4|nr:hypothetical protein [Helicobacter salomonis]
MSLIVLGSLCTLVLILTILSQYIERKVLDKVIGAFKTLRQKSHPSLAGGMNATNSWYNASIHSYLAQEVCKVTPLEIRCVRPVGNALELKLCKIPTIGTQSENQTLPTGNIGQGSPNVFSIWVLHSQCTYKTRVSYSARRVFN